MDPDAALREAREAARVLLATDGFESHEAARLAEHFSALDGWLAGGGFLPRAWAGVRA